MLRLPRLISSIIKNTGGSHRPRLFAEIVKYALSQLKAAFGGAVALYKVLIGIALVELYKLSTAGTLLIQYGLDKLFGYIRFANARRALQYYVSLNVKQIQYIRILLPGYVCFA